MKKVLLTLCGWILGSAASAQFSVGVGANHSLYKENFRHSTPGPVISALYSISSRITASLSFTYGMPIKMPSIVTAEDANADTICLGSVMNLNFRTFTFAGQCNLAGSSTSAAQVYGTAGLSFVVLNYREKIKENYDEDRYSPVDQMNSSRSGFAFRAGIGGQYRIGVPRIYAEVFGAIPANQRQGHYHQNPIPLHYGATVGVRFPLGKN